jgi:hypothetical protein
MKKSKNIEIAKIEPNTLIDLFKIWDKKTDYIVKIKDHNFLIKKNLYNVSPNYSDGDIEFWIKSFKIRYYGGSWNNVHEFITEVNELFNLNINIPPFYNNIVPIVKRYCEKFEIDYNKLLHKYGKKKFPKRPTDKEIIKYIEIYQNPKNGGSIPAIVRYFLKNFGYSRGETTIRHSIRNIFQQGKYKRHFNRDLTYNTWLDEYKLEYFREKMPLDPKLQSHEYIMMHDRHNNIYKRVFIKDLNKHHFQRNLSNFTIMGLSNELYPKELKITNIQQIRNQENLEIICRHGSIIVTPKQRLFTIDDNCNIIEIPACDLKQGTPLLMPRAFVTKINYKPLDFFDCGRLIIRDGKFYIEQNNISALRFINKGPVIGEIEGQYASEGTMPSLTQPTTKITSSIDREYVAQLQSKLKKTFGLNFYIGTRRTTTCKKCKIRTYTEGEYDICPECNASYHENYELLIKTELASTIFTKGLGLKHAYSYLKEFAPFIYNAPLRCLQEFILSYLRGDGSKRDYRDKNGSFDLNIETSSRRMVFGLNFLMRKLGVIISVYEHSPPPERTNSKLMYTLDFRGSSNYEILNKFIEDLPEPDYTTSDIKSCVENQILMRKLNEELKKIHNISLAQLVSREIVPQNANYIATQIKRKANLSEIMLLRTLDSLKQHGYITPLANKMERVFRQNTFTQVKRIMKSKIKGDYYKLIVDGLGFCCGTSFVYVKSEKANKKIVHANKSNNIKCNKIFNHNKYNLTCKIPKN